MASLNYGAVVALLLVLPIFSDAFPFYGAAIPNGFAVPDPCKPGVIWYGVGHFNQWGGGPLNPFGADLKEAGIQWTGDLCQKDSDGDGLTNGEELGDPTCEWTAINLFMLSDPISHPGIDNNNPGC